MDLLSDGALAQLNAALPWTAFTVDGRGRRFGNLAWKGKRAEPQPIPDRRIVLLHERFNLADKDVLEIGCYEGIHTVGLCRFAKTVRAVDSRLENVLKTIVRSAFYACRPEVFQCDVEARPLPTGLLECDIVHHVGVLYHLADPVQHLKDLGAIARFGIMLDTHYALEKDATQSYRVNGREFRYRPYGEFGLADPFSGMSPVSKWLLLEDVVQLLQESGFDDANVVERRDERNGPRALILAKRRTWRKRDALPPLTP